MSASNSSSKWLVFAAGLTAGAVIGVLIAPQSGETIRRYGRNALSHSGRDLLDKTRELYDAGCHLADEAAELYERGRQIAHG